MCPVPQIPRTVSLLGPSPLNAGSVLQKALYNSKYTHLLPNAAGVRRGDLWRSSDRGDVLAHYEDFLTWLTPLQSGRLFSF